MSANEGAGSVKVLTVRQPWASLISLGVKRIETRSWSTSFRGPLAIHAGLGYDPFVPEDPERRLWASGSRVLIEPKIGNEDTWKHGNPFHHLPFGAVVAVADLVDVVPIVPADQPLLHDGHHRLFVADSPNIVIGQMWRTNPRGGPALDVTDQVPYGDFTPGRYAWLLDNVRPIDPVPAKGRQGLWTPDAALAEALR